MSKRLLVTVSQELYKRFRHLAIDHGGNARLLERLLEAHEQLLEWQAQRDRELKMMSGQIQGGQIPTVSPLRTHNAAEAQADAEAFERLLDEGLNGAVKDGAP